MYGGIISSVKLYLNDIITKVYIYCIVAVFKSIYALMLLRNQEIAWLYELF